MEALPVLAPWQQRVYAGAVDALQRGRLAHGLLWVGPEHLGKRLVAEKLAQRVLCERADGLEPCGACRSCQLYISRAQMDPLETRPDGGLAHPFGHPMHPDATFLGYAWRTTPKPARQLTQISVDQMRQLSERFSKSAQYGRARIALIEPADALNESAANALLKTLEEPEEGRYLWLIAAQPARLPATIRSRCQRIELHLPARSEGLAWLAARGVADALAGDSLDAARGNPGLAADWLANGGIELRREVAADLQALANGREAPHRAAQRWVADGAAPKRLQHAADLVGAEARGLTDPMRTRRLTAWFKAAIRTRELLRSPVRADLAVAALLLQWREDAEASGRPAR